MSQQNHAHRQNHVHRQSHAPVKPHLNIGTIGHVGHGKTTLTSAVTKVLGARGTASFVPVRRLDRAPEETARGATVAPAHLEYETDTRRYVHADLPGHAAYVKNMISGVARLDGAVLVVSALDGVMPQTVEHLLLARQMGVTGLVVALSKADAAEPELTALAELQVRDLLSAHGRPGELTPVVRVSALGALAGDPRWTGSIEALLDAVDTYVPVPPRPTGAPFLLPVERVRLVRGTGTVAIGTVERGTLRLLDRVEAPGVLEPTLVTGMETFGRPVRSARAGDRVALLLRGAQGHELRRGDVIVAPGSVVPRRRFEASVRVLDPAEGGRRTPVATGFRPQFHLRTADVPGGIDLGPRAVARPGETVTLTAVLDRGVPVEPGLGFALREGGRTVGAGRVTG
ncbi:elongation factor Tu [Streptomyces sp. AV19]|uniref:elongation factor Tu n=1 Tax=Streptomyces sp. AV19 TaxID=2793068 RepID=UPI0018FE1218|nr:elongation factor Tu [Streptomyces sp. AV19]MBH1938072.1 elongation factor Tu [Streptomyces sp. AV19]MDG4536685.1 elongation factor Tu [Streptomyces sp. AV19]